MAKKKIGKHLQFYMDCMQKQRMIGWGLCRCAEIGYIDSSILELFRPDYSPYNNFNSVYWASGYKDARYNQFTPMRQTITLFMAAINSEL